MTKAQVKALISKIADSKTRAAVKSVMDRINLVTGDLVTSANTPYYTGLEKDFILVDCSSGDVEIYLQNYNFPYHIVRIDNSVNNITINSTSSPSVINGSATLPLTNQYDGATLLFKGNLWFANYWQSGGGTGFQYVKDGSDNDKTIVISATAPPSPGIGDMWIDIS